MPTPSAITALPTAALPIAALRLAADRRRRLTAALLLLGLLCGSWLSLSLGAVNLWPNELWDALWGNEAAGIAQVIVRSLRGPRLVLAATAGAVLAMSGVALQALFRNPLADPALIGVSAGAAVGAASATILIPLAVGGSATAVAMSATVVMGAGLLTPFAAFAGAVAAAWLLWRVASSDGRPQVGRMLLAGVALNALAGSLVGLALHAADARGLRALTGWMLGSLSGSTWTTIAAPVALALAAVVALLRRARDLDALLLGDRGARQLGVEPEVLLKRVSIWVALGVGASVAVTGIIGFIGLVVPHGLRLWLGPRHGALMPLAGLGGATLLVLADVVARTLLAPAELPVGVLTSLLGAPFFLLLIARATASELA